MRVFVGILAGLVAGLLIGRSFAQSPALDPPSVAPHIFATEFENEKVRVLRVHERFGETPPTHSLRDRVVVHVNSCAWVDRREDGSEEMYSYRPGDFYWLPAVTRGGETSNVIQTCHMLMIEVKKPSAF
jgi:hypothetical protein